MKKSQNDDGILKYSSNEDGIFRGEDAKGVLAYLLKDVRYRPDDPYYSLIEAVEFGLPKKPRYQLRDGDYATNEYPGAKGYFFEEKSHRWVAFDNSTYDCFVEDCNTEEEAIGWLKEELELA